MDIYHQHLNGFFAVKRFFLGRILTADSGEPQQIPVRYFLISFFSPVSYYVRIGECPESSEIPSVWSGTRFSVIHIVV